MRDVAGIALLDFILSQQNRIGDIDYTPNRLWVEDGAIQRRKAKLHGPDENAAPAGALRILRTNLNDDDAGARVEYANVAKSTQMLEKMRRFPAATCARLMALDADLRAQGPLHAYLRDSFCLDARRFAQIVRNTGLAAGVLGDACRRGDLVFDVEPEAFFLTGTVAPRALSCDGG